MDTRGKAYTSPEITVYFDGTRCIHAAECVRGLPSVFDRDKRPWVQASNAPAEQVAGIVRRCPSGALRYVLADQTTETPETPTTLRQFADGRLEVRGDLRIIPAAGGEAIQVARATLCTCGLSRNLPFCDNRHQTRTESGS